MSRATRINLNLLFAALFFFITPIVASFVFFHEDKTVFALCLIGLALAAVHAVRLCFALLCKASYDVSRAISEGVKAGKSYDEEKVK